MIYLLVLFPLGMAAAIYLVPSNRWRPWLIPVGGCGHLWLVEGRSTRNPSCP